MAQRRAAENLDIDLAAWRERPLDETPYLVLYARYERVREGGHLIDCAVLVAVGVTADGVRRVLGVSVALSEVEVHWRAFLDSLTRRGLMGIKLIVSDDVGSTFCVPIAQAIGERSSACLRSPMPSKGWSGRKRFGLPAWIALREAIIRYNAEGLAGFHDRRFSSTYSYAAVCPETGESFALVMAKVNTVSMNRFLEEFSKSLAPNVLALLIMDRAGWHGARKLSMPVIPSAFAR